MLLCRKFYPEHSYTKIYSGEKQIKNQGDICKKRIFSNFQTPSPIFQMDGAGMIFDLSLLGSYWHPSWKIFFFSKLTPPILTYRYGQRAWAKGVTNEQNLFYRDCGPQHFLLSYFFWGGGGEMKLTKIQAKNWFWEHLNPPSTICQRAGEESLSIFFLGSYLINHVNIVEIPFLRLFFVLIHWASNEIVKKFEFDINLR